MGLGTGPAIPAAAASCSARTKMPLSGRVPPGASCLSPRRSVRRTGGASERSSASPSTPACTTGGRTSGSPCTPVPGPGPPSRGQRAGASPQLPGRTHTRWLPSGVGRQEGEAQREGSCPRSQATVNMRVSLTHGVSSGVSRTHSPGPAVGSDLLTVGNCPPPTRRQRLELVEPGLRQTPSIWVSFCPETLGKLLAHSRPEFVHLCHGREELGLRGRASGRP